ATLNFNGLISATDSAAPIALYKFTLVSGSGNFTKDGVVTGSSITVPASQLADVGFSTGPSSGTDVIQVVATDTLGAASAPRNLFVATSSSPGPTIGPTTSPWILAELSNDTYNDFPQGADGYVPVMSFDTNGFRGVVYSNDPNNQI